MYTAYYELRQEPFHVTPDPEFLFPSPAHKEALAAIIYGIEQRKGFVAITGEVGVGKTTILRSYLDFADRQSLKLIYVYNSNLTFDELVTTILQELGVSDRPPTSFQAITRLHEELIEVYRKNQTVVLIIDEAQNMPVETLESLRMLSNLETVTEKLIQIMLIGQPELDELLQQHRLRQLRQRIAIHARIDPLNSEDSVAYLEHRLAKVAFGTKPVFTKNALRLIADSAQGIPRNLNILSDNALITGFGSQVRPVNARVVKEVLADRGVAPPPSQGVQRWRGAWVGGVAAAAAIIITMAVLALNPSILKTGGPVQQSEQGPDRATPPPSLAERAPANAPSGVEARAPAAASPPAAPESRPTSGSTNLATRTVPENVQPAPEPPPPVAVAPAPLVQAPPRTAGTVRNEPPQPPARTAQPRPPEAPQAEPQVTPPAPRLAAPPVAAPRAPEIARVEPPAPPRATEPPPAPPRPAAAPPVAVAPPRAAEPPRPAPSGAPEIAANNAAPTPAPAVRRAPVPLQPPPAQRPAAVSPPPAPSVAAVPPPAAAVAVPSIMMPSASGSGTVASLPLAPDAIPPRGAAPARTDQSVRMVRVGDSLWTMAEDVYGFVNPNVLRRVQDANPQLRNINILTPGQEIVFPRVPETSLDRSATQFEGVPSAGRN